MPTFSLSPRVGFWLTSVAVCASLAACGGGGGTTDTTTTPPTPVTPTDPTTRSFFSRAVPATGTHAASGVLERAQSAGATRTPSTTEFLDWAQTAYPLVFPAASASTQQTWGSYTYRSYSGTDMALAVSTDGSVLAVSQISAAVPQSLALGTVGQYACAIFPTACHASVGTTALAQRPGLLSAILRKPRRFLVGLGSTSVSNVQAQGLQPDIWDQYLVGASAGGDWRSWNSPDGAYVQVVAANADTVGAVPMFTLYQMATNGDGNIQGLTNSTFMTRYWDNVRVMYQQIKAYGKPVLVNLEPDFWGYAYQQAKDPTQPFAHVAGVNSDCSNQPNTVAGVGNCLVQMARTLAPNAYVGFPPSMWPSIAGNDLNHLKAVGAATADFVVMQTSDRDAGCFEVAYTGAGAGCDRPVGLPVYWDDTNPNGNTFAAHLAQVSFYHQGLGLPVLWWQTPLGVPSTTPGGAANAFRDNRVQYFLTQTAALVAAGGVGAVFSPGHSSQTSISTDGGQFKRLSTSYLGTPAALP
ncbi:MAG TPA: hypothetical protein VFY35_12915 [Burkholderiaceae bacterium]|nr:hypothetical protein [Burkholderiaceae bacterium]